MEVLTTGEMAEVLNLRKWQLDYLIDTRQVIKPRKTLLGRRFFYTSEDLLKIRQILTEKRPYTRNE